MRILRILLLLVTLIAFMNCSKKHDSKSHVAYDKISFGSGGGFTGRVKSYTIRANGILESDEEPKEQKTLTKKTVERDHFSGQ